MEETTFFATNLWTTAYKSGFLEERRWGSLWGMAALCRDAATGARLMAMLGRAASEIFQNDNWNAR
jgi:hypothetical protein